MARLTDPETLMCYALSTGSYAARGVPSATRSERGCSGSLWHGQRMEEHDRAMQVLAENFYRRGERHGRQDGAVGEQIRLFIRIVN
jgi:hypothetical protein